MQVHLYADETIGVTAGALVVPFFSESPLEGVTKDVDAALGGAIADALASGEIRGKLGEHVLVYAKIGLITDPLTSVNRKWRP